MNVQEDINVIRRSAQIAQLEYVYIIKCEQFYKIGKSKDVVRRVSQMEGDNPLTIVITCVFPSHSAHKTEQRLHALMRPFQHKREWFILPEKLVHWLQSVDDIDKFAVKYDDILREVNKFL